MSTSELYQRRKPSSPAHALELARMALVVTPAIWGLKIYDAHLATKLRGQPDLHELARRARGESFKDAPMSLPRTRKRSLTTPLPAIETMPNLSHSIRRSRQRTVHQAGSLFLTMLPFEIRQDIYEEVLAGGDDRLVHVLRKSGRLGHWRCRIQNGKTSCDTTGKRCVEGWLSFKARLWHWDKAGMVDLTTDQGILDLLLTCRVIYSEAIKIVYSKNVFHFYDPGDVRFFGRTVLPQRLNSVTELMMDWERPFSIFNRDNAKPRFGNDELKAWVEAWDTIKRMTHLRVLRVTLKSHQFQVTNARRRKMCEPMMEIKGLRVFELIIPLHNSEDWSFAENAPFKIVRQEELFRRRFDI